MEDIDALSLFDGMATGRLALEDTGIGVRNYFSSEVDKHAMTVAEKNFPDIKQIGDVTKIRGKDYKRIPLIIGGSPCFVAGTKVWSKEGYKNIEDVRVGDLVFTHKKRYRKVLKIGGDSNKEILSLKAQGICETFVTGNHPYYVSKMKRVRGKRELETPKWQDAENLVKGDFLGLPINNLSENPLNLSSKDIWLLGRFVADGYTQNYKRKDRPNTYIKRTIFCIGKHKIDDFLKHCEHQHYSISDERTAFKVALNNRDFMDLCNKFGKYAHGKFIPGFILDLPANLLGHFLNGYMSGDGCKTTLGRNKASSVSKELILGLNLIIAKVNKVNSSFEQNNRPSTCVIEGRTVNQRTIYALAYRDEMKKQSNAILKDGFIWLPVKSIEKTNSYQDVYNLEVEEDNSYTSNNATVQ